MLSTLLQSLRVPHVVASSKAVAPIFRLPFWFPDANAALELNTMKDRLMSGKPSGTAHLRRRQRLVYKISRAAMNNIIRNCSNKTLIKAYFNIYKHLYKLI